MDYVDQSGHQFPVLQQWVRKMQGDSVDRIEFPQVFGTVRTRLCGLHRGYTSNQRKLRPCSSNQRVARRRKHFKTRVQGARRRWG